MQFSQNIGVHFLKDGSRKQPQLGSAERILSLKVEVQSALQYRKVLKKAQIQVSRQWKNTLWEPSNDEFFGFSG